MKRFFRFLTFGAFFTFELGLATFVVKAENHVEGSKPNVIFILTDDMGYGDLGVFYQNQRLGKKLSTPNLDLMAREGIQLRQHYCPAPVCAPSRASLLRGLHQGHTDVRNSDFDKAIPNNHTLATVMKSAGYQTLLVGKYGLQGLGPGGEGLHHPDEWSAYPTKRGFDDYFGLVRHNDGHVHYPANDWPLGNSESHRTKKEVWHNNREVSSALDKCYTTDLFTAYTKNWIVEHHANNPNTPFFIYLAFDTPHAALQVPTQAYPQGAGKEGGLQWIGEPGRMINTAIGEIDSWIHPDYRNPDWSNVEQRYATMVRRIDSCVGDLIQLLKDLEIDEETLIVLTNDNGPLSVSYIADEPYTPEGFQSYGPFDGEKRDVWEGGIRMPALAWWPGAIPANRIDQTPSQFHDWMTTFAELGGVPMPAMSDGVSLVPMLTGRGNQQPGTVYVEFNHGGKTPAYSDFHPSHRNRKRGEMQVIFLDGFKGVRVDIKDHSDDFEIYDVNNDRREVHNLASSNEYFENLHKRMKDRVLQIRRPNSENARPYDREAIPGVEAGQWKPGIQWKSYAGSFPWVPKFWEERPQGMGGLLELRSNVGPPEGAVVFEGYLNVPEEGDYQFYLKTSTKAVMRIHDAIVIDADFGYQSGSELTSTIKLQAGWHPISLSYLRKPDSPPGLDLSWSGPSIEKAAIANKYLFH